MNEEQKAINAWFESDEGKSCCDHSTLELKTNQYLSNRLWRAFTAGQSSGRLIERTRILDKIEQLLIQ